MDITARIKLHGEGGEQLAQEFRKGTKELEKMGDAAKGVKVEGGAPGAQAVPGAPLTPDKAAVSPEFAARMAQGHYNRDAVNARKKAEAEERESKNQSQRGGRGEGAGDTGDVRGGGGKGRTGKTISAVTQATESLMQGDIVGATAQGVMAVGAGTGLIAGGAIAAGGATLMLRHILAQREMSRVNRYFSTGMSQSLGLSYNQLRSYMIDTGRTGIPEQTSNQVLSAMREAGGEVNASQIGRLPNENIVTRAGRIATAYGMGGDVTGRLLGLQMTAGVRPNELLSQKYFGMAEAAFGRGGVGQFVERMSTSIERGMVSGLRKASPELISLGEGTAKMMAGFVQYANLTPQGAEALTGKIVDKAIGRPAELGSAAEFTEFRLLQKPGEDYFKTLQTMSTPEGQTRLLRRIAEDYKSQPVETLMKRLMSSSLGKGKSEAELRALANFARGTGKLKGGKLPEIDPTGLMFMKSQQANLLAPTEYGMAVSQAAPEAAVLDALGWMDKLQGKGAPSGAGKGGGWKNVVVDSETKSLLSDIKKSVDDQTKKMAEMQKPKIPKEPSAGAHR